MDRKQNTILIMLFVLILVNLACTLTAGFARDNFSTQNATISPTPAQMPLKPTPRPLEATKTVKPNKCTVLAENLHLRASPGITALVKDYLREGEQITVTGKAPAGLWVEVITQAGLTGWVNSTFTNCKGELKP